MNLPTPMISKGLKMNSAYKVYVNMSIVLSNLMKNITSEMRKTYFKETRQIFKIQCNVHWFISISFQVKKMWLITISIPLVIFSKSLNLASVIEINLLCMLLFGIHLAEFQWGWFFKQDWWLSSFNERQKEKMMRKKWFHVFVWPVSKIYI